MSQPPSELITGIQTKAFECFSVVTEANHRVLQELVGLSAAAAKEGLRATSELQSTLLEVAPAKAPSPGTPPVAGMEPSPLAWYQQGLTSLVEGTQHTVRLLEANARVLTRSAERLQACLERSQQELQQTLTTSVGRVREICGRN